MQFFQLWKRWARALLVFGLFLPNCHVLFVSFSLSIIMTFHCLQNLILHIKSSLALRFMCAVSSCLYSSFYPCFIVVQHICAFLFMISKPLVGSKSNVVAWLVAHFSILLWVSLQLLSLGSVITDQPLPVILSKYLSQYFMCAAECVLVQPFSIPISHCYVNIELLDL